MTVGFALVTWPAKYGETGVLSFMFSHDGPLYQKNPGPKTDAIARAIACFEPDASCHEAAP